MDHETATAVGSLEAEQNFATLLERVTGGEEITITQQGVPVARLIPVRKNKTVESRRLAIQKMRELSARNHLAGLQIKDLINEGRR